MIFLKLLLTPAMAFILKPSTLVQKVVENSGSGVYVIEQEVQFATGQEPVVFKEQWTVEDDSHMKLVVTGPGVRWSYLYEGPHRTEIVGGSRQSKNIGDDFFEKYFHFHKADRLQQDLVHLQLMPSSAFARKAFRNTKDKDLEYKESPFLRLARVGGVVAVAMGPQPESDDDKPNNFFVEQDQFVWCKLRWSPDVELTAEKYSPYARGLNFPRSRTIKWGDKMATIQTMHVQTKFDKKTGWNLEPSQGQLTTQMPDAVRATVEEFYKRFR